MSCTQLWQNTLCHVLDSACLLGCGMNRTVFGCGFGEWPRPLSPHQAVVRFIKAPVIFMVAPLNLICLAEFSHVRDKGDVTSKHRALLQDICWYSQGEEGEEGEEGERWDTEEMSCLSTTHRSICLSPYLSVSLSLTHTHHSIYLHRPGAHSPTMSMYRRIYITRGRYCIAGLFGSRNQPGWFSFFFLIQASDTRWVETLAN